MTKLKTAEEILKEAIGEPHYKSINSVTATQLEWALKEHTRQYIRHFAEKASWLHEKEIREIEQDILQQLK